MIPHRLWSLVSEPKVSVLFKQNVLFESCNFPTPEHKVAFSVLRTRETATSVIIQILLSTSDLINLTDMLSTLRAGGPVRRGGRGGGCSGTDRNRNLATKVSELSHSPRHGPYSQSAQIVIYSNRRASRNVTKSYSRHMVRN